MFHDPASSPAARYLEANYQAILEEFRTLHEREFVPWPERYLYGEGWTIFGLYSGGRPIDYACRLCPRTAAMLARIDGLGHAGFSRLAGGTHIQPHCGRPKTHLRCHLGLRIPAGELGLRVEREIRSWQEGRCLLFDDTLEHEAWNRSAGDRVVLLADLPRTGCSPNQPGPRRQRETSLEPPPHR